MRPEDLQPGYYRHYQGDVYEVMGVGKEAKPPKDDRIDTVYYRRVLDWKWYHCPVEKFCGTVLPSLGPETPRLVPRFTPLDIFSVRLIQGRDALNSNDAEVRKLVIALGIPDPALVPTIMKAAEMSVAGSTTNCRQVPTNLGIYLVKVERPSELNGEQKGGG